MSPKGRSFIFLIFCNKLDFQKAQRVPPSTILKTLRFLSLGYGADFRRSRLVLFYSFIQIIIFDHSFIIFQALHVVIDNGVSGPSKY